MSWEGSDIVSTLASAVNSVQFDETVSECESSPELTADEGYEADVEIRDHLSEQVIRQNICIDCKWKSIGF